MLCHCTTTRTDLQLSVLVGQCQADRGGSDETAKRILPLKRPLSAYVTGLMLALRYGTLAFARIYFALSKRTNRARVFVKTGGPAGTIHNSSLGVLQVAKIVERMLAGIDGYLSQDVFDPQ